jgi:FMN-dependent oxidoreductase (nitrilotriacetate monooxygenase family)
MNNLKKRIILGGFCPLPGHHPSAWKLSHVDPLSSLKFEEYIQVAKKLEEAAFDFFFLSDGVGIRAPSENLESLSQWGRLIQFEPAVLMSALAQHTKEIGFVATMSTTYQEPFHIARFFSSLDHITKGRIAWNIVTSVTDAEAQNFSLKKQISHEIRYDRAHEALQVVTGLWNSWDEDAFDKSLTREIFFDPAKARFLNHSGKYFSVRGPLNIHRSPQNFPVLVQAGSSEMGRNFAARWSEIIFTAQMDLASAIEFGKDIRIRCSAFNRDPLPLIMPGGLSDFIDFVLPHLRSMNLVQLKYGQGTLREKLRKGLS